MKYLKDIIFSLMLVSLLIYANSLYVYTENDYETTYNEEYCINDSILTANKQLLIDEVTQYINSSAPKSKLTGESIVNACEKYEIDIVFVLAQGWIEGKYATNGLSNKMNSVFNVGAWDGMGTSKMTKFKHPDHSIEPYLELLETNYLVNGKTETDLLNNYINFDGKRYASDGKYEYKLRNRYKYILNNTNIKELETIYIEAKNNYGTI